jgi:proteasome beta subunit
LWEAADSDSATGGPDALRGVYPIVATINQAGWTQVTDNVLAEVFASIAEEVRTR